MCVGMYVLFIRLGRYICRKVCSTSTLMVRPWMDIWNTLEGAPVFPPLVAGGCLGR